MAPLVVESWTWWTVVILVAICRGASRTLALGSVRRLQSDDWLMLVALCFYTTLIVTINIVANTSTNLFPLDFDISTLTQADKSEREFGSKLVLVVEQCQILTIWCVKGCILLMYSRLTIGRSENIAMKALAGYVVFGFVLMEVFYFGLWCRPFHNYWAVPTPSPQCNAATNHLITNAVFNLSSDTILLAIALPMFIRSRLPMRKKAALVGVFGLGLFVMLCAILNKYYSFSEPFGSKWTFWYVRESSTALLVGNLPYMWTLLRRIFPFKGMQTSASQAYGTTPLSQMRKESHAASNYGIDPESGRQTSDAICSSFVHTPEKGDPDVFFLTTPSSFADSWRSQESGSSVRTPTNQMKTNNPDFIIDSYMNAKECVFNSGDAI